MSNAWKKRKARLTTLINADDGDEDAQALVLDQLMHGHTVIGKTARTTEIDSLRFTDKDVDVVGTLEYGQFGVIDVVTCKLDGRVYVRKSVEKRFALRTRDQCSPQLERDILLRARKTDTEWAPHLLCAFQTPTHLNLLMEYIEGGTLWDVLESSPHDGKLLEADLHWWAPQIVNAIHWCHSQGFVHRDVKPHNFVITPDAHLRLIDFGSAAPLLPPGPDGSQNVAPEHCSVPCGTCDYISPEILQAHEEALVALEMEDDEHWVKTHKPTGYGRETDWWSMGAMLYEMVYGVAPFFARDIKHTYVKIMDHHKYLKFDAAAPVSHNLQDLLRRLLTTSELRLGRLHVREIREHSFFKGVTFKDLHKKDRPPELHTPQFTYATPVAPTAPPASNPGTPEDSTHSRGFAFSALFQSSPLSAAGASAIQATPSNRSILRDQPIASSFIGFSWGPPLDAFVHKNKPPSPLHSQNLNIHSDPQATPRPLPMQHLFVPPNATPSPFPSLTNNAQSTPIAAARYPFATPVRPNALTPFQTLPRASTIRRTAQRRAVSDREAMKQLVDCVGMSARKKVLESGRKPRVLLSFGSRSRSRSSTLKELRFDRSVAVVADGGGVEFRVDPPSRNTSADPLSFSLLSSASASGHAHAHTQEVLVPEDTLSASDADSDVPPSPSPTPRPGSAMSMLSRRSQTPTGSYFGRALVGDGARRSVSPAAAAEAGGARRRSEERDEESRSVVVVSGYSYELLDQLERRHARLMGDIRIAESRLDEVCSMISR